jgi:phosphogluconate dehydratase
MLMEAMGLHLPGAAFVNPDTPLRDALTRAAVRRALETTALGNDYTPIGHVLDERAFVNGMVALLATGGSTNLTIHMIAMAKAGGLSITWDDFADLAAVTPLLARVYPSGAADVNGFRAAGGTGFIIRELVRGGVMHGDIRTVWGTDLSAYAVEPALDVCGALAWRDLPGDSRDRSVVRPFDDPFQKDGGLRVLDGNLGRAIIKVSAIPDDRHVIEAPAAVFQDQESFHAAFKAGALDRDVIVVVRHQGPRANGMPELHHLTPQLQVLQKRGHRVALVTDGRLSGASGRVPAALHVTPEALDGGMLARVRDGDVIRLDADAGTLQLLVADAELARRTPVQPDLSSFHSGTGRELFASFRHLAGRADDGASPLFGVAA